MNWSNNFFVAFEENVEIIRLVLLYIVNTVPASSRGWKDINSALLLCI